MFLDNIAQPLLNMVEINGNPSYDGKRPKRQYISLQNPNVSSMWVSVYRQYVVEWNLYAKR